MKDRDTASKECQMCYKKNKENCAKSKTQTAFSLSLKQENQGSGSIFLKM